MKINQVVSVGFGAILFLVAINSLVEEWQIRASEKAFNLVVNTYQIKLNLIDIQKALVDSETGQRGFLISKNEDFLEPYDDATSRINSDFVTLYQLFEDNPIQLQRLQNVENLANQKLAKLETTISLQRSGESQAALELVVSNDGQQIMDNLRNQINVMIKTEEDLLLERKNHAVFIRNLATFINLGTLILVIISGSVICFFVIRIIMAPIQEVTQMLATSSSEIAVATEEQERLADYQAVSINETTNSIEKISESAKQSAQDADHALVAANQVLELSENGNQVVKQNLESITELNNNVANIAQQIDILKEHTGQIGTISNLVASLANQTNILALNASVEAVRAGEYGRGFSLVALEVRKLSDQSKDSAKQIDNLVSLIKDTLKSTIQATQQGTENVKVGMDMTENTAEVFMEIATGIKNVVSSNEKIAKISEQQAIAIQQIVQATNSINHAAIETASGIKQTQSGTQNLNEAAENLRILVGDSY